MIRRKDERTVDIKQYFGGEGTVEMHRILNTPEELSGKGRLFNHVVLHKGCEIGWHVHEGDGETYYILKGTAEYNDKGNIITLHEGDVASVYSGEGHGIKNISDETLEVIALILYS